MSTIKTLFVFIACAAMLIAGANHQGRFGDRNAARNKLLETASEKVLLVPMNVGQWTGIDLPAQDEAAMKRGGAVRYLTRAYRVSGESEPLTILFMCGKPGPLCAHTPEICYAGASYTPDSNQRRWKPVGDAEFTWQTFSSRVEGQSDLEIAWAWTTDGRWGSPEIPRLTYGAEPFLYKLYVVRSCTKQSEPSDQTNRLLKELVPAIKSTVFAASATPATDAKSESSF